MKKLKSLKEVELLNSDDLLYISGGSIAPPDSNKNDSKSQDSKKGDTYN